MAHQHDGWEHTHDYTDRGGVDRARREHQEATGCRAASVCEHTGWLWSSYYCDSCGAKLCEAVLLPTLRWIADDEAALLINGPSERPSPDASSPDTTKPYPLDDLLGRIDDLTT